jgi:hypothetical protein
MERKKIIVSKIKYDVMCNLRSVLKFYILELHNRLADKRHTNDTEIVYSVCIDMWYYIDTRLSKRTLPDHFTLNVQVHDARIIVNSIINYFIVHNEFDGGLDSLKNAIHQQLTYDYETISNTGQEHPKQLQKN